MGDRGGRFGQTGGGWRGSGQSSGMLEDGGHDGQHQHNEEGQIEGTGSVLHSGFHRTPFLAPAWGWGWMVLLMI